MSWRHFWRNTIGEVAVRYRGPGNYPFNLRDVEQMDRLGRGSDFQNWLHLRDLQYSRRGSVPWVERSYDQLFQHFVTRPVKQTALGLSGATAAGALSYASMLYAPKVPKRQSHRLRDADADSVIVSQASRYRGHYRSGRDGSVLQPDEPDVPRDFTTPAPIYEGPYRYDFDANLGDIRMSKQPVPDVVSPVSSERSSVTSSVRGPHGVDYVPPARFTFPVLLMLFCLLVLLLCRRR